ncbi:hypothetical protein BD413DRAFT_192636 [Trametes elegans]|nr:hypothetical protein BD413DRAFT_192636 [Trametes elegans]
MRPLAAEGWGVPGILMRPFETDGWGVPGSRIRPVEADGWGVPGSRLRPFAAEGWGVPGMRIRPFEADGRGVVSRTGLLTPLKATVFAAEMLEAPSPSSALTGLCARARAELFRTGLSPLLL